MVNYAMKKNSLTTITPGLTSRHVSMSSLEGANSRHAIRLSCRSWPMLLLFVCPPLPVLMLLRRKQAMHMQTLGILLAPKSIHSCRCKHPLFRD
jgi:hypothetical protein